MDRNSKPPALRHEHAEDFWIANQTARQVSVLRCDSDTQFTTLNWTILGHLNSLKTRTAQLRPEWARVHTASIATRPRDVRQCKPAHVGYSEEIQMSGLASAIKRYRETLASQKSTHCLWSTDCGYSQSSSIKSLIIRWRLRGMTSRLKGDTVEIRDMLTAMRQCMNDC